MGRGKLKMESVSNEKKRNIVFNNKKASLIKQIHQLTVLCDVKACMIIYYGSTKQQQPQIWPHNLDEVRTIIDMYNTKLMEDNSGRNKTYGLSDFFKDKKRKVEQDFANLRKQNLESKYSPWFDSLDDLTELQLREFAENLGNKAALVESRIELLKNRNKAVESLMCQGQVMDLMNFEGPGIDWSLVNRQQGIPSLMPNEINVPYGYNPFPCVNNNGPCYVNENPMMSMLMNGNGDEFGDGFFDPVNLENPGPVGWYSGPPMASPMPMPMQTFMQSPRQLQFPTM